MGLAVKQCAQSSPPLAIHSRKLNSHFRKGTSNNVNRKQCANADGHFLHNVSHDTTFTFTFTPPSLDEMLYGTMFRNALLIARSSYRNSAGASTNKTLKLSFAYGIAVCKTFSCASSTFESADKTTSIPSEVESIVSKPWLSMFKRIFKRSRVCGESCRWFCWSLFSEDNDDEVDARAFDLRRSEGVPRGIKSELLVVARWRWYPAIAFIRSSFRARQFLEVMWRFFSI